MLKALDGFDDIRGTSFRAYAEPTILGELRRHFRDKRWAMRVPRDLKEALPKIRAAPSTSSPRTSAATRRPPRSPSRPGMEEDVVIDALEAAEASRPASLDAPVATGEPDAATIGDLVGSEDENIDQAEWNVLLEERLEQLDDRDREVLYLRFVEDLTQREIGERIGVSQMQVSRILSAALDGAARALLSPPVPRDRAISASGGRRLIRGARGSRARWRRSARNGSGTISILGIPGSVDSRSLNVDLLGNAAREAPDDASMTIYLEPGLWEMPPFEPGASQAERSSACGMPSTRPTRSSSRPPSTTARSRAGSRTRSTGSPPPRSRPSAGR